MTTSSRAQKDPSAIRALKTTPLSSFYSHSGMEVISIDSSDDDDVPEGRAGSEQGMVIAALRDETQDTTQSDDGSVSSADSIWDEACLSAMPIRCERVTGRLVSGRGAMKGASYAAVDAADEEAALLRREHTDVTNNKSAEYENPIPACTVDAWIGKWKVMLLMDFREFSDKSGKTDFLQVVENKVNRHFGGVHCEKLHLPSADYLYVARLISNATGEVIDERVLDLIIERKDVNDLQACLTLPSKCEYLLFQRVSFCIAQQQPKLHLHNSVQTFIFL